MAEPHPGCTAVFDPRPLNGAQKSGRACVSCGKRWPRPRVPVGFLPHGEAVMACDDCAQTIITSLAEHKIC